MTPFTTKTRTASMALALALASVPTPATAAVSARTNADGRILTIAGDAEADQVAVILDHETDAIEVWTDSARVGSFPDADIATIRIRLGGGVDLPKDPKVTMGIRRGGSIAGTTGTIGLAR